MAIKRVAGILIDPISGATIGYEERYGDKTFRVLSEDNGEREKLGRAETLLVDSARKELRRAGFPTDDDIIAANQTPGTDSLEELEKATDQVAKREGHTSRLWLAMRYLTQRYLLVCRVAAAHEGGPEVSARVAYSAGVVFAVARQEWHDAYYGTDDAAYHGRRQYERLAKGRRANRERSKGQIIAAAVLDVIDDPTWSCRKVAERIKSINAALVAAGKESYADTDTGRAALAARIKQTRANRRRDRLANLSSA